ncbi:MAG: dihydroorotase [Chloroflexota bacterium]
MNLIIQNGRILDPLQGIDRIDDLVISEGKIVQLGPTGSPRPPYRVLDATGMIVCPGFIDIHCHLRQPGFEEKETIATGTIAAANGGFTAVCCMPNTHPPIDTKSRVEWIQSLAHEEGVLRVLPIGCVTKGREGEKLVDMRVLREAGVVAFSDDGSPVWNAEVMRRALQRSKSIGLPITNHCEELTLSRGGDMNAGKVADRLGYRGIPPAAEDDMVERDLRLASETGGRLHIAHVSTAKSVEMIRQAKKRGINVTAEVTPHHLTLTEEAVIVHGTNAKVNPPLRTTRDVAALVEGLRDGTIDAIATDHAPHSEADKSCPFSQAPFGISGFETALGAVMSLVHQGEIDLSTLVSKLTYEPARVIGRSGAMGSLKIGAVADVTIFAPNTEWTVNPSHFASKGRNTPLAGNVLKGQVMTTIAAGQVVHTRF